MSERPPAIEITGLHKRYGEAVALDGVDLRVERGEICGFLGPNGAGKSTTLRVLAQVERPDRGAVRLAGHDVVRESTRAAVAAGYMPERFAAYDRLSIEEYLEFFLGLYHRAPSPSVVADALDLVGMTARSGDLVGALSKGQRQRVLLARSVLHDPEVLLLDEPTSGLDPRARSEFKAILRELRRMGKSVLISSHVLPDLDDLCDRIVLLVDGRVHAAGRTEEIRARFAPDTLEIRIDLLDPARLQDAVEALAGFEGVSAAHVDGGKVILTLSGGRARMPPLHRHLVNSGLDVVSVECRQASLDELYMALTA